MMESGPKFDLENRSDEPKGPRKVHAPPKRLREEIRAWNDARNDVRNDEI